MHRASLPALADTNQSLKEARDFGHGGNSFLALNYSIVIHFLCGDCAATEALANELFNLADEQESLAVETGRVDGFLCGGSEQFKAP
jgi:hypothetical protein